jgi:hypothetical protein
VDSVLRLASVVAFVVAFALQLAATASTLAIIEMLDLVLLCLTIPAICPPGSHRNMFNTPATLVTAENRLGFRNCISFITWHSRIVVVTEPIKSCLPLAERRKWSI